MPPVEFRSFQTSDLDRILEIEGASFGPEAWDRDLFLEYARNSPDLFLIARRGRRIAGYIITCTKAREAELVSIAVHPRDRLQGIGRFLMDATLAKLRSRGVKMWWLMVAVANARAIRFYQAYGFTTVQRSKAYYGSGRDAWRMRFRL